MEQRIINYVHNASWFQWEEENNMFATRDHGDIGEEEFSDIDYKEGLRVKRLLLENFRGSISHVYVDVVDEWVTIEVD